MADPVGEREVRLGHSPRAASPLLPIALALTAVLLAGCGGADDAAKVEASLRHYLNTLDPLQSSFPVGAGPPLVKENGCKKVQRGRVGPARLPDGLARPGRPPEELVFWSCGVRFAKTPFQVLVALRDSGEVAWATLVPRLVLRPGTATVYQGGPEQPQP